MPKVTQQIVKPTVRRPVQASGSLLASAVSVGEMEDDYIKLVLYGRNRVGKTTLACQFPKPLLLVAVEPSPTGGAKSVRKVAGVDYLRLTNADDVVKLAGEVGRSNHYRTVVLDSVTSLQDIILKEIMGWAAVPDQMSWGTVQGDGYRLRSEKTRECLRPWVDLRRHTVFIAKEKDHNPRRKTEEGGVDMRPRMLRGLHTESFFAADLGGATVEWLQDACDYIVQLTIDKEYRQEVNEYKVGDKVSKVVTEVETGRLIRKLRTMYHPNYAAGIRSENPDTVPEFIQDPTFDKINAVIKGEGVSQ